MKVIGEKFMQLMPKDFLKGFTVAVLTVLITFIGQSLEKGEIPMDLQIWMLELKIAFGTGMAYIVRKWLTNSEGDFLKRELKK